MPFVDTTVIYSHPGTVPLDKNLPVLPKRDPSRVAQTGFSPPNFAHVTELVRYMKDQVLHELIDKYATTIERPLPGKPHLISPNEKVCTNTHRGFWEHVSDLSGLAITAAFEWKFANRITAFGIFQRIPTNKRQQAIWFAKHATQFEAWVSGYESRLLQMGKQQWNRFDWLVGYLDRAVDRIAMEVAEEGVTKFQDLQFESRLAFKVTFPGPGPPNPATILRGRPDIVFDPGDGKQATIWEIKLVKALKSEHIAQLMLYGLLWAAKQPDAPFPRLLLFNVRDGARLEVVTTLEKTRGFVEELLRAKYTVTKRIDDTEFWRLCEKTMDEARFVVDRIPQ